MIDILNEYVFRDGHAMEMDDSSGISSSSRCRRRSPNVSSSRNHKGCYTTLIGGEYPQQLIDCQIILVNPRQRFSSLFLF